MRKLYILAVLMGLCTIVHAQPEIRSGHPRIFFNSETWPQIKERAYGEKREYLDKLIEEVNQMPDDPVAENYGPIPPQNRNLPIPAVKEFVLSTSLQDNKMLVRLIEGMRTDES